jgi:DNA/RNA endonuclease YhcR with UshA esterase domain
MSRFRIPLIAGALVALAACNEAAAPKGTPGDLTVRAYIDRDASGAFSTGDSALAGVQLTATPNGQPAGSAALSATTDAAGQAVFQDLAPGSYTVAISGGAPTGVVLTTNPTPTVGISFQGAVTGSADFRYSFQPGSLSGRIYRDDNGNGSYDAGTDTPGANFLVTLRADDNGAAGAVIDSVRADADGAWSFPRLAPGRYFVEYENPGTISYGASGNVFQVVVTPQTITAPPGVFTGSLVVPIAQARDRAAGANVEIEGVITVAPGMFTTGTGSVNSEVWVQDATGGIAVLQVPTNTTLGLTVGKRVKVSGTRFDNAGQKQIGSPTVGATITTRAGADSLVTAQAVTVDQAIARTGFEGELVVLSGFTVTSVGSGADYTVSGTVNGTAIQLRIESSTGIASSTFTVGNRYVITGVLTQFNGTSQIKPRSPADVTGPTPIATVRAATSGAFTVSGSLTVAPGQIVSGTGGVNSEIWVQDATGGIAVFSVPTANAAGLALGDIVEVTGTRGANASQIQLANPGLTVTRISAGTPLAPRTISAAELVARTFDGQLVRLSGFTVTAVGTASAVGAFNVTGTASNGQSLQVRVGGAATGIVPADFTVGSVYTITGVQSIFNTTLQLKPRVRADIVAGVIATPANVIINEFMANPATTTDPAGEYIELYNAGGTAQDISGWRINDYTGSGAVGGVDTIGVSTPMGSPILIQPGQHFLMVHTSTSPGTLPGSAAIYRYKAAIQLNNSGTERLVLKDANGVTIDSVAFTAPIGTAAGIARGVVNAALDNTDASVNWADQTTVFTTGERGTPGQLNDGAVIAAPALLRATTAAPAAVRAATTRPRSASTDRR